MRERVVTSAQQASRSWIGSALVILAIAVFLITLSKPQSPAIREIVESVFHTWVAMGIATAALVLARRPMLGPLPLILRFTSGVLLPVLVILTVLGLLIWPPIWEALKPFGVTESETRPGAITATITVGVFGCALLMLRALYRWVRSFGRKYEHSGLAVGIGPLYFFFRRRRVSHRTCRS